MSPAVVRSVRTDTETRLPGGGARPYTVAPKGLPRIDGYRLEKSLGQGGMGIVYLARELALDRFVALKVLPPRLSDEPDAVERFRREARALAQIEHPNIVPIYSIGEQEGLLYFTMAYVEGETLSDVVRAARSIGESRFSAFFARRGAADRRPDLASALLAQAMAEALADLHGVGIVHRDIKPANIVIDARGRAVLVDFGVACDPHSTRLTTDATSPGTLRFMSPEQLDAGGAAAVDVRSDIYALGLTLFETLTLRPAFPQDEMGTLIDAIRRGEMPRPRSIDPAIPSDLDEIVSCASELDPDDRFQSAEEMLGALRAATAVIAEVTDLQGTALCQNLDQALADRKRPARTRFRLGGGPACSGPLARRRKRSRSLLLAGGAALAACLTCGAAWQITRGEGNPLGGSATARAQPGTARNNPPAEARPGSAAVVRASLRSSPARPMIEDMNHDFGTAGREAPLRDAVEAFLAGRAGDARKILGTIQEPDEKALKTIFWILTAELGDPRQQQVATDFLSGTNDSPRARLVERARLGKGTAALPPRPPEPRP